MRQHSQESATPYMDLLRIIGLKMKLTADKRVSDLGVSAQQARVIGYIYRNQDEGVMQKDLAAAFHRRGASITSMLQGLEKNGYIERIVPQDNERKKLLYVLPKGKALVEQFHENFSQLEKELTAKLTDDEKQELKRLLEKVNGSLPEFD